MVREHNSHLAREHCSYTNNNVRRFETTGTN